MPIRGPQLRRRENFCGKKSKSGVFHGLRLDLYQKWDFLSKNEKRGFCQLHTNY